MPCLPFEGDEEGKMRKTLSNKDIADIRRALDRLSRLGAEPCFGNSEGNMIAQEALAIIDGERYGS